MRMDGYYYGFNRTGAEAVDRILSAVACAGKAYHHTDSWTDEGGEAYGHRGTSAVAWIQNAANDAAERLAALERCAELLRLKADMDSGDDTDADVRLALARLDEVTARAVEVAP